MTKIVFSGFGGQGIMTLGQLLASMAMKVGKQVSWLPSYGAEMRGGTANCSVVISNLPIGNPYVLSDIDILCAFNLPSIDKFLPHVRPGGTVIVNSSIVTHPIVCQQANILPVDASNIASTLGNAKVQNMVMLGRLMKVLDLFTIDQVKETLEQVFAGKDPKLVSLNLKALAAGM